MAAKKIDKTGGKSVKPRLLHKDRGKKEKPGA